MTTHMMTVVTSGLLPQTILQTSLFRILTAFVAVNTVMYGSLALAKVLPKVHLADLRPGGRNRRGQDRSIYPQGYGYDGPRLDG